MDDRPPASDQLLEVAAQRSTIQRHAIEDVAERLDLEEITIRRRSRSQWRADAAVVHHADIALAFDAHRVRDQVA